MTKQPTPAQLKRKIERLEATIADMKALDAMRDKSVYDLIAAKCEYEYRVKHAIEILQGGEV